MTIASTMTTTDLDAELARLVEQARAVADPAKLSLTGPAFTMPTVAVEITAEHGTRLILLCDHDVTRLRAADREQRVDAASRLWAADVADLVGQGYRLEQAERLATIWRARS